MRVKENTFVVYYESRKRELKIRLMNEGRIYMSVSVKRPASCLL